MIFFFFKSLNTHMYSLLTNFKFIRSCTETKICEEYNDTQKTERKRGNQIGRKCSSRKPWISLLTLNNNFTVFKGRQSQKLFFLRKGVNLLSNANCYLTFFLWWPSNTIWYAMLPHKINSMPEQHSSCLQCAETCTGGWGEN